MSNGVVMRLVGLPSRQPVATLFIGLFALHCVLNLTLLLPLPSELNQVDYPRYIRLGQQVMNGLAEGRPYIPGYNQYPAAILFYAVLYPPFRSSIDWLMLTGWTGNMVLSPGLWVVAYLVARRMPLQPYTSIAAGGLLFLSPVFYSMLSEAPYALFPLFAGVGLWQFLGFLKDGRLRYLWVASAAIGLASLTRADGVLQFGILIAAAALVIAARHRLNFATWAARGRTVVAVLVPWTAVLGLYFTAFVLVNGTWDAGVRAQMHKSYVYFEMSGLFLETNQRGEPIGAAQDVATTAREAIAESRRLYGTPEENGHSVLKAVLRNKTAALQRIVQNGLRVPSVWATTYGGPLGAGYLLLAGVGLTYLLRRDALLAVSLLLWSGSAGFYLLFFTAATFAGLHYAVVIALAGLGLARLVSLLVSNALVSHAAGRRVAGVAGGLLVLAVVLVQYHSTDISLPVLGHTSEERVARYLFSTQPRGTRVASAGVLVPYMAKMEGIPFAYFLVLSSGAAENEEFSRWLQASGTSLIYIDPQLERTWQGLYTLINSEMPVEDLLSFREQDADRLALCEQQGLECVHRLVRVHGQ